MNHFSAEDRFQAKGRVIHLKDMTPEEQERIKNSQIFWIEADGTIDDRVADIVRRKSKIIEAQVSQSGGAP